MTPQPPYDRIVNVSLPAMAVALGYVTVGGFWQDQGFPNPHWKQSQRPPAVLWSAPLSVPTRWESD